MLLVYVALIGSAGWLLFTTPQGFIPAQDRGLRHRFRALPGAASLARTTDVVREIERIALDTPGIVRVAAFAGFSGATRTQAGNAAALFPVFEEPEVRLKKGLSRQRSQASCASGCRREELVAVAPEGFTRARFVTGGAEANEMALQLARRYHVDRGESKRWQVISPAQAYHGPTMATLALTGRPGLKRPLEVYMSDHLHIRPAPGDSTPPAEEALKALDRALEATGPETSVCLLLRAISAAGSRVHAPKRFLGGPRGAPQKHGFPHLLDEIVTGIGRYRPLSAAETLPWCPTSSHGQGLRAGYAAIGAVLCRQARVRRHREGLAQVHARHSWDGAPLSCASGWRRRCAEERRPVEHVKQRGKRLRDELATALRTCRSSRGPRPRLLLGIEYVDPRDHNPSSRRSSGAAARRRRRVRARPVTYSTMPTRDGFRGRSNLLRRRSRAPTPSSRRWSSATRKPAAGREGAREQARGRPVG